MSVIALITWIVTASGGLYLLSIWLIEYDKEFQSAAATRLPPAVLASHVLMAAGGLVLWALYLIFDSDRMAWISVAALAVAASLGTVMAIRWVGVYRAGRAGARARFATLSAGPMSEHGRGAFEPQPAGAAELGPPERNFPLPVVVAHGTFAFITIALVVLTALGVGGS